MIELLKSLLRFLSTLGLLLFGRKSGQEFQELKQKEEVIDNVKKADNAVIRLTDDIRKRLRERYSNK